MSIQVEAIISSLSGTTDKTPPHPSTRGINMNGAAFQSLKNEGVICVTEPVIRRTIACNKDLFEEGYDSDGDIDPFFNAGLDEEDIEYYI